MCHLILLATGSWPKMAKSCDFPKHVHIRDSQYPLRIGGGWGLFVFHKYFLVFKETVQFYERDCTWQRTVNYLYISFLSLLRREALLRGREAYYDAQDNRPSSFIADYNKAMQRNQQLLTVSRCSCMYIIQYKFKQINVHAFLIII